MTWKGLKQHNLTPQETRKRTTKPKVSRRKGITKIRVEVNEIEVRKTTEKMNETGFFWKINKIDKFIKKKRDDSNKVISETVDITTNTTEIQGIKDYDEQ